MNECSNIYIQEKTMVSKKKKNSTVKSLEDNAKENAAKYDDLPSAKYIQGIAAIDRKRFDDLPPVVQQITSTLKKDHGKLYDKIEKPVTLPKEQEAVSATVSSLNSTQKLLYTKWKEGSPFPNLNKEEDRIIPTKEKRRTVGNNLYAIQLLYDDEEIAMENYFWFTKKHRELIPLLNAARKVALVKKGYRELENVTATDAKMELKTTFSLMIALKQQRDKVGDRINDVDLCHQISK